MYHGVKITIGRTNSRVIDLLDLARRQFDHLGRDGIVSKRRQSNRRYRRRGCLRFPLRTRRQARRALSRIRHLGEPAIRARGFSNPNAYPHP
jgi:hypothetical protein